MKRILTLGLILMTVVYVLPFVYQGYYNGVSGMLPEQTHQPPDYPEGGALQTAGSLTPPEETEKEPETGKQGESIRAKIGDTVREIPLEEYIAGVLAAEMPASFPEESLKAQAVAARTYVAYKRAGGTDSAHPDADVCGDYQHCAAYVDLKKQAESIWGKRAREYEKKVRDAVASTAGEILTYEDAPIAAVFHAASSSKTEAALDVWGTQTPYLVSVDSPGGQECPKYKGEVTFTAAEFREKMARQYPGINLSGPPNTWFTASTRSKAGGVIKCTVGGVVVSGPGLRSFLGLNSTNFKLSTTDDSITFLTTGYGHGVGLSQYGAKDLAEEGQSYQQILTHYYSGTKIQKK